MRVIRSCVYLLFNGDELVYIGKSTNMHARIGQHVADEDKKFDRFEVFETNDQDRLEEFLIRCLKPKYNKVVPSSIFNDIPSIPGIRKSDRILYFTDGKMEEITQQELEQRRSATQAEEKKRPKDEPVISMDDFLNSLLPLPCWKISTRKPTITPAKEENMLMEGKRNDGVQGGDSHA